MELTVSEVHQEDCKPSLAHLKPHFDLFIQSLNSVLLTEMPLECQVLPYLLKVRFRT